jgi:hypothetical protein
VRKHPFILIFLLFLLFPFTCGGVDLWKSNKLTPEQPFPADVVILVHSWVGCELLLKERDAATPRYCYVNIEMTRRMHYVLTTAEKAGLLFMHPFTRMPPLDKSIPVAEFSAELAIGNLGAKFGEADVLRKIYFANKERFGEIKVQ